MKSLFFFSILLVALLLSSGCSRYKVPAGYPKPDEMAQILADIYVVDATLTYLPGSSSARNKEITGSYRYVLERHGLTSAEFDTIRKWYVSHPDLYQKVYEQVLERLSNADADVKIIIEREKAAAEEAEKLAIQARLNNLWPDSTFVRVYDSDSSDIRYPFRIEVDTLALSGRVRLRAGYKFLRSDESRNTRMMLSAFYNDSLADTVYKDIKISFQRRVEELVLKLKDDTIPKYIDGFLLLQDSLNKVSVEIDDIRIRVVPDSLTLPSNAYKPEVENVVDTVIKSRRPETRVR